MKHAILIAAAALLAALPGRAQDVPAHPDQLKFKAPEFKVPDPGPLRAQLQCGMVVYAVEDRSLPKIDLSVLIRAGSFWEPEGKEGVAGLVGGQMRVGGTKNRKPEQVDEELEFLAAQAGVSVGDTQASASLSVLSKDLDAGLAVFTDLLANPAFAQDRLDLAKAQVLQRLKARNDAAQAVEARESNLLLYGDFPSNRHPTSHSVASITREDLAAFHARFFHPANMIMAVAGDFRREELLAKLESAFGNWPVAKAETVKVPEPKHVPVPGAYFIPAKGKVNQGRVTLAHLGIRIDHPDAFPIRIMSYILGGGGFSSRLVARVRTDEGLAYDVGSDYRPGIAYTGAFRIQYQSRSESCLWAGKICLEEIARMQEKDVTPEELDAAKNFYLEGFAGIFFPTPARIASTFASAEFNGYPKDFYSVYRQKIAAVTAADVRRCAKEHMQPSKFVALFVGDVEAMKKGDGQHAVKPEDFGPVVDLELPDPLTLKRPAK